MKYHKNKLNTLSAGFIFLLIFSNPLSAQEKKTLPAIDFVYEYAVVDPSIDSETDQKIKERVKTMVQQYAYSSDFGEYTGEFSSEKYEMFSNLFTNNARVTNYILKKPGLLETYQYTGFIWDNIRPKSLDQKFKNGELLSIEKDASGNYRCNVILFIDVNSLYDEKTKVVGVKSAARRIELKGLVIMESGNIDAAKFVEMKGKGGDTKESNILLSAGALYGLGALSGGSNRGFNNVKPSTNSIGLYADVSKGMGASGKWQIWAGLGYQSLNIKTDITGKYNGNVNDVSNFVDNIIRNAYNGTTFPGGPASSDVFITGINSGEENISGATLLTGAIGIGYQMKAGLKNKLMIKAGLVPTFLTGVSKGNRNIDFLGYELPQFSNFPDIKELEDNGVVQEYSFSASGNNIPGQEKLITAENNFSLSVLLAPSLQIPIGFRWGLDIGVAYSLGLNNLFKHTPADNNFLGRESKESQSIIQDYLPSSKHNQFQARVGIFLTLN